MSTNVARQEMQRLLSRGWIVFNLGVGLLHGCAVAPDRSNMHCLDVLGVQDWA